MSDTLASCESVSLGKLVLRLDRSGAFAREISVAERSSFEVSGSSSVTQIGARQC